MFYQYFRFINYICNVFGVSKPHITLEGKSKPTNIFVKIWCLLIAVAFTANYGLTVTVVEFKLRDTLELMSDMNDAGVNIFIIIVNIFSSGTVSITVHKTFNILFNDFNFDSAILRWFATKMYFWFSIPAIVFVTVIVVEISTSPPPFDLFLRIPMFLCMMHLFMHLYVILALLKVVNNKLYKILHRNSKIADRVSVKASFVKYVLNPSVKFAKSEEDVYFDLKLLCKNYDDLCTAVHLLEQNYGFEILLSIWLMFTNGVVGVTLIATNQAEIKWLVFAKGTLPVLWALLGCCINEQLRTEVVKTNTVLIKCLIDYRCVPLIQPTLETFKQLVSNDGIHFTACSLFNLSYAMLLGIAINVITYSIILIQIFLKY